MAFFVVWKRWQWPVWRAAALMLPFLLIVLVYMVGSAERRGVNPNDKILPPISEMAASVSKASPQRR